jgi:amino-acid N-acetyltransferase
MAELLLIRRRPSILAASALLKAQGLPASDITDEHLENFFYIGSDDSPIGLIGLELYGADCLLRSLVVGENDRSRGFGSRLIQHAEQCAASKSVRSIYLLTTTAEAFFKRLGYARIERSRAPLSIERTREFASLCPASSAFMAKPLSSPG